VSALRRQAHPGRPERLPPWRRASFTYLEATAEKNFTVTGVIAGILTFVLAWSLPQ
jgi:hypothetical protein